MCATSQCDVPDAPREEQAIHDDTGPEGGDPWGLDRLVPEEGAVSVIVHPGRLRQEMARRGWAAADLARESRLSQATVGAALAGKPVAERSMMRIANALSRFPVLPVLDSLLMHEGPGLE
jgi:lambda repressor-like predicted transcriptional regulator